MAFDVSDDGFRQNVIVVLRVIEIIRCTLRRYFFIGQQHPQWNADAGQFQVGPSGITLGDENENQEEFFEEEFNIYQAGEFLRTVGRNKTARRASADLCFYRPCVKCILPSRIYGR